MSMCAHRTRVSGLHMKSRTKNLNILEEIIRCVNSVNYAQKSANIWIRLTSPFLSIKHNICMAKSKVSAVQKLIQEEDSEMTELQSTSGAGQGTAESENLEAPFDQNFWKEVCYTGFLPASSRMRIIDY